MFNTNPIPKGKMIFIAKSKPFQKDGKTLCKVSHMVSKARQIKKQIMQEKGFKSGKQFRKWLRNAKIQNKKP
jgi:hypothetical protein